MSTIELQQRNRNIRKYQTEVITKFKSILDGFKSRLDKIERISELEDKANEFTQKRQKKFF